MIFVIKTDNEVAGLDMYQALINNGIKHSILVKEHDNWWEELKRRVPPPDKGKGGIVKTLLSLVLLSLVLSGCSGVTSPVGINVLGTGQEKKGMFGDTERRNYGWEIDMPEYSSASIEYRSGLMYRCIPDSLKMYFDTLWIKIEDKNHDLNNREYRVKYE